MKKIITTLVVLMLSTPAFLNAQLIKPGTVAKFKNIFKAGGTTPTKTTGILGGAGTTASIESMRTDGANYFESASRAAEIKAAAKAETKAKADAVKAEEAAYRKAFGAKMGINMNNIPDIKVYSNKKLLADVDINSSLPGKITFVSKGTNPEVFGEEGKRKNVVLLTKERLALELDFYKILEEFNKKPSFPRVSFEYELDMNTIIEGFEKDTFFVLREFYTLRGEEKVDKFGGSIEEVIEVLEKRGYSVTNRYDFINGCEVAVFRDSVGARRYYNFTKVVHLIEKDSSAYMQ